MLLHSIYYDILTINVLGFRGKVLSTHTPCANEARAPSSSLLFDSSDVWSAWLN